MRSLGAIQARRGLRLRRVEALGAGEAAPGLLRRRDSPHRAVCAIRAVRHRPYAAYLARRRAGHAGERTRLARVARREPGVWGVVRTLALRHVRRRTHDGLEHKHLLAEIRRRRELFPLRHDLAVVIDEPTNVAHHREDVHCEEPASPSPSPTNKSRKLRRTIRRCCRRRCRRRCRRDGCRRRRAGSRSRRGRRHRSGGRERGRRGGTPRRSSRRCSRRRHSRGSKNSMRAAARLLTKCLALSLHRLVRVLLPRLARRAERFGRKRSEVHARQKLRRIGGARPLVVVDVDFVKAKDRIASAVMPRLAQVALTFRAGTRVRAAAAGHARRRGFARVVARETRRGVDRSCGARVAGRADITRRRSEGFREAPGSAIGALRRGCCGVPTWGAFDGDPCRSTAPVALWAIDTILRRHRFRESPCCAIFARRRALVRRCPKRALVALRRVVVPLHSCRTRRWIRFAYRERVAAASDAVRPRVAGVAEEERLRAQRMRRRRIRRRNPGVSRPAREGRAASGLAQRCRVCPLPIRGASRGLDVTPRRGRANKAVPWIARKRCVRAPSNSSAKRNAPVSRSRHRGARAGGCCAAASARVAIARAAQKTSVAIALRRGWRQAWRRGER